MNIYSSGNTPLIDAAFRGDLAACEAEIKVRPSVVFETNEAKMTALHMIAGSPSALSDECRVAIARLLLKNGSKIAARDKEKFTPLMFAAQEGVVPLCDLFVQSGAKVDAVDNKGNTALLWAARKGHLQSCLTLIGLGANVRLANKDGTSLGIRLAQSRKLPVLLGLHQAGVGVDFSMVDGYGWNPLHWAAKYGQKDMCRFLLDHGLALESMTEMKQTPLEVAAIYFQEDIARFLIESGAKTNVLSSVNSGNLLHKVIDRFDPARALQEERTNMSQVIDLLLKKGMDPNGLDKDGITPLYKAAKKGLDSVCMSLIKHGADASVRCANITAIGAASKSKHKELAEQMKAAIDARKAQAVINGLVATGFKP
jgi:ankyrin repeat protein